MPRDQEQPFKGEEQLMCEMLFAYRLARLNAGDRSFMRTEVAKRARLPMPTLDNWETGRSTPGSWDKWHRWARALGLRFRVAIEGG